MSFQLYFQHRYYSLLSHDPSEIILICRFGAQEIFLIIINVENSRAASYICGDHDIFFQVSLIEVQKNSFV